MRCILALLVSEICSHLGEIGEELSRLPVKLIVVVNNEIIVVDTMRYGYR